VKKNERYSYYYSQYYENVQFLERIKDCIEGNVSSEIIKLTIVQIDELIKKYQDKIKLKNGSGSIEPNLIRS
jgi:hypothetical protein